LSILDIFKTNKIKLELDQIKTEYQNLKNVLNYTEKMEYAEIKKAIDDLNSTKDKLEKQIEDLNRQASEKRNDLIIMDEEVLLQSFGFYKPKYELENSEMYKTKLDDIRKRQSAMVKSGDATVCSQAWTVNGSEREGSKMIKDYVKLILRSFNNECDASIINVKFNNIDSIEKKITKAYEMLNKLGHRMNISISNDYFRLKLEELHLCYEYQVKKQEEREEQKRIREQMREEAKLMKEIEEARIKLEKEEKHFRKALEKIEEQLKTVKTEEEKMALEEKSAELRDKLAEIEKEKQDIQNRENNTRAGYVYIISNIGSFGENVYKIGVTRRLDPHERVDELGDASVPFNFDVHAMIFSEDAPALENALHKAFEHRRLNMINLRREFFKTTLGEIESVVKSNYNKTVEFIKVADASQYRQSIVLCENKKI